ncbi:RNase H domain-containing protein [Caerostris darwini]|uniref:RNase H domain-containing protein n=1 Tax=Caerostris darwini TaxID=1538125 RepID=A0AAV4MXF9_9ARAC|nr:RNase H domain-containing protein [Caerostris darwini]
MEIIHSIPRSYTDGSRVFRSELQAIRKGLQYAVQAGDHFQDIWILTDSRASIQHLSNWGIVGDQTSMDILKLLDMLSPSHTIHFLWISSHVGVEGNEKADSLAKSAAEEDVSRCGTLTFWRDFFNSKNKNEQAFKTPPSHSWYFARKPGGYL